MILQANSQRKQMTTGWRSGQPIHSLCRFTAAPARHRIDADVDLDQSEWLAEGFLCVHAVHRWNQNRRPAFEGSGRSARSREGHAMSQELEHQVEVKKPGIGSLAEVPNLGFVTRRKNSKRDEAWRETLTQHMPESWPAARLALQARIAALDVEA
jgi:hypothetical protein